MVRLVRLVRLVKVGRVRVVQGGQVRVGMVAPWVPPPCSMTVRHVPLTATAHRDGEY